MIPSFGDFNIDFCDCTTFYWTSQKRNSISYFMNFDLQKQKVTR